MRIHVLRIISILLVLLCLAAVPCPAQDKVTILYDAFGESKQLTRDWGFSALVEHHGKRILFDTGNDAAIFEHNVQALGVDLTKLDFVAFYGQIKFDERGVNIFKPMVVEQWQNGKKLTVWPSAVASGKPMWPAADWSSR